MLLGVNKDVSVVPPPIPTCSDDDFDFYVTPRHAEFFTHKTGASRHLMVNGTNHRLAVKIKCSNNRLYRVTPVYTCLAPGRAKRLQIIRDPGGSGPQKDKLILVYKPTRHRNPRDAFLSTDSGIGHEDDDVAEVLVGGRPALTKKTLIALVSFVDESITSVASIDADEKHLIVPQPQAAEEIDEVQLPVASESSANDLLKRMMEHIRLSPLSHHNHRKNSTSKIPATFGKFK